MPTGRETVVNKALSGSELKKIILTDCQRLVDAEGMLSEHIAFGRVSYMLTLKLHVDNPYIPDTAVSISSQMKRDAGGSVIPVVEAPPLANPSPEAEVGSMELTRSIDSPNAERLRAGMSIPATVKGPDGTTTTEQIKYPEGSFPELGPGEVMIKDATDMAKDAWKIVEPSQTEAPK